MLRRKKPTKLKKAVIKCVSILLSVTIAIVILFETGVKSQLSDMIIVEMKNITEIAIVAAVNDFIDSNPDIGDRLIKVNMSEGKVSAITTDPAYINKVKTGISLLCREYIDKSANENGVDISLGSLSDLVFLADFGPTIHLSINSKQTIKCEFESSFESAGVNQTLHHITLTVNAELSVYNPYRIKKTIHTSSTFEIAQTVIVGSVPSYSGVISY